MMNSIERLGWRAGTTDRKQQYSGEQTGLSRNTGIRDNKEVLGVRSRNKRAHGVNWVERIHNAGNIDSARRQSREPSIRS